MSDPSATDPDGSTSRGRFAAALRHRNYRLFWIGTLISNSGDWLDQVALNWLIIEQSGSALDLGLVNLCRALPIFGFMLIGGAVADRVEQRRLLFIVQVVAMTLGIILAILVFAGMTPIWALMLIATLRGTVQAFNLPARHSLIAKIVPKHDLANAVALNSVTINLTKVIGPLMAGLVIAGFGVAACFAINAVSFVGVLWTLVAMKFPAGLPMDRSSERIGASIVSGLKYVAMNRIILLLVLASLVPVFVGQPFITLLTVYAHDTMTWGAIGLGILTSAAGAGSAVGALMIAGMPNLMRHGWMLLILLVGFGCSLMVLALNPIALAAPVIVFIAGANFMCYVTALDTMMHMIVPNEYRGRLMSMVFLNRGLVPLGTACAAALAYFYDIRTTYFAMGVMLLVFALALAVFAPRLRKLHV